MKHNQTRRDRPIAKPILKELVDRQKADFRRTLKMASVSASPLPAPALYEDAGEGYNTNFDLIQQ